ncbi:MAG TPA: PH domain-containing protein [Burkholderiales bacterium]|jgi:uncharacterized membrane protein YdbT with pleckstrin-like domain
MKYDDRPAWHNQWWQIAVVAALAVLFVPAVLWGERYFSPPNLRVVLVVMAAVFVYLLVVVAFRRYSWRYTIDDRTIESRHGVIARNVQSIRIQDLRNVNVRQSLVQRLLRVGNVEFSSAGGAGIEVVFHGVSDPMAVKALAQRLQNT